MIALLLTLAIFPIAGAATARLLRLPLPPARLAFVFLLGLGTHGSLLYALGCVGVPIDLPVMIAIPALSVIAVLWHNPSSALRAPSPLTRGEGFPTDQPSPLRRGEKVPKADEGSPRPHPIATVLFAIPLLVLLFATAIIPTRDYDGRVTWLPKARAIALEHTITGPFFHGQRGINLHNRYPLLLPLDAATLMRLTNDTRNETPRWMYVLIPIAALLVMRSMLNPWIAAIVAWLPVLTTVEGGALAAYSDLALAAFAGVAVLYLIEARSLRVTGLFAAFAVMTKNEGAVLAMAIVIAAVIVFRLKALRILIPIAVAEAIVVYWRTQVPAAYDEQYEVLISSLPQTIGRIPTALLAFVRHAAGFSEWGVFWIAVAIATVIALVRNRSARLAIPLIVIAIALGAYVMALTVTSWNIAELAPVAVNRLLAHLLIPASCILATMLPKP
ncbi:MAG: hypothetical protein ACJ74H_04500 [Thermoanaerobaculia bacterium]